MVTSSIHFAGSRPSGAPCTPDKCHIVGNQSLDFSPKCHAESVAPWILQQLNEGPFVCLLAHTVNMTLRELAWLHVQHYTQATCQLGFDQDNTGLWFIVYDL